MNKPIPGFGRFVLRILLGLVPAFLVWYLLAPWLGIALAFGTEMLFDQFFAGLVKDVLYLSSGLRVDSNLADATSVLVNPLLYGYGIPMIVALTLAGFGGWPQKLGKAAIGVLLYLPVQAFGVYFDGLIHLELQLADSVGGSLFAVEWKREAVRLAYQLGFLILPGVMAILIWVVLNANGLQIMAKKE